MDSDSGKILILIDRCDRGEGGNVQWPMGRGREGAARFSALLLNLQYEGYIYEESGHSAEWLSPEVADKGDRLYFGEYHLTARGREWVCRHQKGSQ